MKDKGKDKNLFTAKTADEGDDDCVAITFISGFCGNFFRFEKIWDVWVNL